jgi:hypothetical protein
MPMCNDKVDGESRRVEGNLLKLGGLALLVGVLAGLVGAVFRLALVPPSSRVTRLRSAEWFQQCGCRRPTGA